MTADTPSIPLAHKNAAAMAWLEQWYATPDAQPPGYWDALEEFLQTHPFTWGTHRLAHIP
jgi:hypothetical protein